MIEQNIIYQGDTLESLRMLPDECIDMCVTSPPYYALRDYGTARLEGGDPNCDHSIPSSEHDPKRVGGDSGSSHVSRFIRNTCYKCGAVRIDKQIGLEETPEEYIAKLTDVFSEVKRVLKPEGTLWLNIGDSYNGAKQGNTECVKHKCVETDTFAKKLWGGAKPKDLIGIPWMLAFSLRNAGWYLRQDIIWHKPNPMPESVTDRCTKSHEYIFLLSKSKNYYFNHEAIQEEATGYDGRNDTMMHGSTKYKDDIMPNSKPNTMSLKGHERWKFKNLADKGQQPNTMHERRALGMKYETYPVRNKRSVWSVNTSPCKEAHFAVFPEKLIQPCILAGCPENGIVLDPFMGSGTTAVVARKLGRNYIGCELNPEYIKIIEKRLHNEVGLFL